MMKYLNFFEFWVSRNFNINMIAQILACFLIGVALANKCPPLKDGGNFLGGNLLTVDQQNKLNVLYGKVDQRWRIIYKATENGFEASAFHKSCDKNEGPTVAIIQSTKGWLFGGFTKQSWASSSPGFKNDSSAFIYTLTNPNKIPPTRFNVTTTFVNTAIWASPYQGPTFGAGFDILVGDKSNTTTASSYTNFPGSYKDTIGKANATFTGEFRFVAKDIEVFTLAMC